MNQQETPQPTHERSIRVIKPHEFDSNTPQTPGMRRAAAVSRQLAGSEGLWAGVTIVDPSIASGKHHHGDQETIIYVVSGNAKMRWGEHLEFEADVEPGDFIYVPPFVPHQEINPSPDTPSQWVIVRNSQEPIVVNLEPTSSSQQAANDATHPHAL
ncbi:MAG TPA: cupin domain-containing protein [Dictyobacter sp.]|nr:cupin domain-containing protein [Dictyobacter sp.]